MRADLNVLLAGVARAPMTATQVISGKGLFISAAALLSEVSKSLSLRDHLTRYLYFSFVQASEAAFSYSAHSVEKRLARLLLGARDRAGNELRLTHEAMAAMLHVRRPGVTVAMHVLEGIGAIRALRSQITIRDYAKLEIFAGSGYGSSEAEYRRLFGRPLNGDPDLEPTDRPGQGQPEAHSLT